MNFKRVGNMLNRTILYTILIILVLTLSGCNRVVKINEIDEKKDIPILNKLVECYQNDDKVLNLNIQSIELKVDNSFKGKTAIVYKKKYDNDLISLKANDIYIKTQRNEYDAKVINSLEQIILNLADDTKLLKDYLNDLEKTQLNKIIQYSTNLANRIKQGQDYNINDMNKWLNENKSLIEKFLAKSVNRYAKELDENRNNIKDYVDTLALLKRTYTTVVDILPEYKENKNYIEFSNKVIKNYNDDILRHSNIHNNYKGLIDWAEEELFNNKPFVDHLYFIKEDKKAKDIQDNLKANSKDYLKYIDVSTYQNILSNIEETLIKYTNKYNDAINDYDIVMKAKKSLEDIKSVKLQSNITALNIINEKNVLEIKENYEKQAMQNLTKHIKDTLKSNTSTIKYLSVDKNANEIFVRLRFDKVSDLMNYVYINTVEEIYNDNKISDLVISDILGIKCKFLINNRRSTHLIAFKQMLEDINHETERLKVIKLSIEASGLKHKVSKQLKTIEKQYNTDMQNIYTDFADRLQNISTDTLMSDKDKIYDSIVISVNNLNEKYDSVIDNLLKEFKDIYKEHYKSTKEENVNKVIDMLNDYENRINEQNNNIESLDELNNTINSLHIAYMSFDNPPYSNMRISIEGEIFNKLNTSGKVDLKDNYHIGAIPSSHKSIRLLPEADKSIFLYKLKPFGRFQFKVMLITILVLMVLIRLVSIKIFKKLLLIILLMFIAALVLYPVTWIIGSSFNKTQSLLSAGINPIPSELSLLQYQRLFRTTKYLNWYANTFKIASINMILSVFLTVSTAYVFSRFKFKGKKTGLISILVLQIFPSFLGMVAVYILLSRITFLSFLTGTKSLIDTHLGLILVYACGQIPYNTWLVKGYFDTIPKNLDEAARIDGATNLTAFWKIILPLGRPIISFVAVTNFMGPWMDFIFPRLIIKSPEKKTLAIGLYEMINGHADNAFTMFAAGAVLVAIPITILFSIFQKYIVTGLSSGAVKG